MTENGRGVLVLTGAGDSFSAGMDLKEYFREVDEAPDDVQRKVRRQVAGHARGERAADEATFGLSEVNCPARAPARGGRGARARPARQKPGRAACGEVPGTRELAYHAASR